MAKARKRAARQVARRPVRQPAKRPAKRAPRSRRRADPGARFAAAAETALERGEPDAIADESLHRVLAAAVRLFAAKAERREGGVRPFPDGAVSATETVVAVCAMIRAADLSPFDVAMWFHRLPKT